MINTSVKVVIKINMNGKLITTGLISPIKMPDENIINRKPKLKDARLMPFRSSILGYKAATNEYPGRNRIIKIVMKSIIDSFNLEVKTITRQITVVKNTKTRY